MRRSSPSLIFLDDVDRHLLTTLELNARQQNLCLAQAVQMSESACSSRIKRLEQQGVIKRYIAEIDLTQVYHWLTFVLTLTITAEGRTNRRAFEAGMVAAPNIIEARRSVGSVDYLLTVVGAQPHACDVALSIIDPHGRFVASSTAHLVTDAVKPFAGSPQLAAK